MTGSVELDADGANLVIRFKYRPDLVEEVKALPERRFDGANKVWRVPTRHVEEVYKRFSRLMFDFAPEVMSAMAGTLGNAPKSDTKSTPAARPTASKPAQKRLSLGKDDPAAAEAATDAITISTLNLQVQATLKDRFPQTFWVTGEIVDFDKQGSRQHRFFALIEKAEGESRPRARANAVLFERTLAALQARFARTQADFALRDGLEVRVLVKVDFYPASGQFQLIVEDVDPSFTLGKLALTREQILRELREAGLAERNRQLGFPVPMLRIGVLSSPDSDGWNDFLRHLQESGAGFDVTLIPVFVQGEQLRASVLGGLRWFAEHKDEFDAVCILRGGGSRTDLAGFDDREVAFAVAKHPLKILIGIGHERDQSVLDLIAHSAKTPTAVADFLIDCLQSVRQSVQDRGALLADLVRAHLLSARRELDHAGHRLHRSVDASLQQARGGLQTLARDLARESLRLLTTAHGDLARAAQDISSTAQVRCARERSNLDHTVARLTTASARRLEQAAARIDNQASKQRLLDPRRVLGRGFALVRSHEGRVLPEAARVQAGQNLVIQLRDGTVHTIAAQVHVESKP